MQFAVKVIVVLVALVIIAGIIYAVYASSDTSAAEDRPKEDEEEEEEDEEEEEEDEEDEEDGTDGTGGSGTGTGTSGTGTSGTGTSGTDGTEAAVHGITSNDPVRVAGKYIGLDGKVVDAPIAGDVWADVTAICDSARAYHAASSAGATFKATPFAVARVASYVWQIALWCEPLQGSAPAVMESRQFWFQTEGEVGQKVSCARMDPSGTGQLAVDPSRNHLL